MQDKTNTTFGWILFSGIVALGLSIGSGMYFHADSPEHLEEFGYPVEGGDEEGGADAGPSLAMLLASGDAAAGEKVFAKCVACHTINAGGATGIGPNLNGVIGTNIASHAPGFAYSSALADHGGVWSYENLDAWLKSPRGFANGTKMSFAGLSSAEDRANVILYMRENGGGPSLPVPEEPAADAADPDAAIDDAVEGGEASAVEAADATGDLTPVAENAPAE